MVTTQQHDGEIAALPGGQVLFVAQPDHVPLGDGETELAAGVGDGGVVRVAVRDQASELGFA